MKTKRPPVNLTPLQKDYAVYLPAISSFYSTYVAKQRLEEFVPNDRIPAGFDRGIEGMNFLKNINERNYLQNMQKNMLSNSIYVALL